MILEHFGLREQPFGVTPDPRFLYPSNAHREALASLIYGIEAERGFLSLVAAPGLGKTTLLFQVLDRLQSSARTAFLFQTQCSSRELLSFLLADLGVDYRDQDAVRMHQQLNELLAREARLGRRCVIVIDEAQNLDQAALETLRLLSCFETPQSKLMQIVIAGQPGLGQKLADPSLAQLRQRISVRCELQPLRADEVGPYIDHRLRVAGGSGISGVITQEALELIAAASEGVPRNINNICFNALSLAYALGEKLITKAMMQEAAADLNACGYAAAHYLQSDGAEPRRLSVPSAVPSKPAETLGINSHQVSWPAAPRVSSPMPAAGIEHRGQLPLAVAPAVPIAAAAAVESPRFKVPVRTTVEEEPQRMLRSPAAVSPAVARAAEKPSTAQPEQASLARRSPERAAVCTQLLLLAERCLGHVRGLLPHGSPLHRLLPGPGFTGRLQAFLLRQPRRSGLTWERWRAERIGVLVLLATTALLLAMHKPADQIPAFHSDSAGPSELAAPAEPPQTRWQPTAEAPPVDGEMGFDATRDGAPLHLAPSEARPHARQFGNTASAQATPFRSNHRTSANNRLVRGKLINVVHPAYPPEARAAKAEGLVILKTVIDERGAVRNVEVVRGHPLLQQAAIDAVRQWRYQASYRGNRPVPVRAEIAIAFALGQE